MRQHQLVPALLYFKNYFDGSLSETDAIFRNLLWYAIGLNPLIPKWTLLWNLLHNDLVKEVHVCFCFPLFFLKEVQVLPPCNMQLTVILLYHKSNCYLDPTSSIKNPPKNQNDVHNHDKFVYCTV